MEENPPLSRFARTGLIPSAGLRVAHAEPVHELPSFLPPVRSCMDVHGNPALQPDPISETGESPVPAVQGPCGNGSEECNIAPERWIPCPAGPDRRTGRNAGTKPGPCPRYLRPPDRRGITAGAATVSMRRGTGGDSPLQGMCRNRRDTPEVNAGVPERKQSLRNALIELCTILSHG